MWATSTVGDLTDNFDALRVPVRQADRRPGPYPYYGASGIVDYVDGYLFDGDYLLIAEDGENLRTRKTPVALIARGRFWVNNHAHVVRANEHADTRFLAYAFEQTSIDGYLSGSTQPKLTQASLNRIRIVAPPRDVQTQIARFVGALDDKIDLNGELAATVRELARALFRSRYRTDDPGLPHEPFGEHVDVARGLSYTGAGLAGDGMPLHNLNSIFEGGGYKRAGIKHYRGDYQQRHLVEPGDVVVATVEQGFDELLIGFPGRIPRCFGDVGLFSQDLFRLRPKEGSPLSQVFVYLALLPGRLHEEVAGYANGTTINRIPIEALQKPRFAVPPRELVEELDAVVTPLLERAEAAEDESQTLTELRATLLPKLISGELRIRDADAALEAAAG
jgi:type I restriction enzyme, S subunit